MLLKLGTTFIALLNKVLDKLHNIFVVLLYITFKQWFDAFRGLIGKLWQFIFVPLIGTSQHMPAFLFPGGYQGGFLLNPNLSSWKRRIKLQCCGLLKCIGVKFNFQWMIAYDCFHISSFHDSLGFFFFFLARCFSCIFLVYLDVPFGF